MHFNIPFLHVPSSSGLLRGKCAFKFRNIGRIPQFTSSTKSKMSISFTFFYFRLINKSFFNFVICIITEYFMSFASNTNELRYDNDKVTIK